MCILYTLAVNRGHDRAGHRGTSRCGAHHTVYSAHRAGLGVLKSTRVAPPGVLRGCGVDESV